jgi:hypothetical protein
VDPIGSVPPAYPPPVPPSYPTPAPPAPPPRAPSVPKPGPLAPGLVLVGVVLLLLTIVLPWTVITVSQSSGGSTTSGNVEFDTFNICTTQLSTNLSTSSSSSSTVGPNQCIAYASVFGTARGTGRGLEALLFAGWAVFFAGVALAGIGGVLGLLRPKDPVGKDPRTYRRPYGCARTGAIVALIGGLFIFLLFTLATSGISNAACDGAPGVHFALSGSCSPSSSGGSPTSTWSWGPGYALYLLFAGFAVVLVGAWMLRSFWKSVAPAPLAAPVPPSRS